MSKQNKPHKHAELIKANINRFVYQDGKLLWAENYGPRARKGSIAGSIDSSGYMQVKLNKSCVLVHRIIWFMHKGTLPEQVDHINRNRSDNRIENLRESNNTKNQHNASTRKDNTTGCTGVTQRGNRWIARITSNKQRLHLGSFETFEQAKVAYLVAKEKYHAQST